MNDQHHPPLGVAVDRDVGRDWASNPPTTMEEAFQLCEELANKALDRVAPIAGMRGWTERRQNSVVVVWEDGEVTNELEINWLQ